MKNYKKYKVRINCPCFQDIDVVAKTQKEAVERAHIEFQCPGDTRGESPEILSRETWVCSGNCDKCEFVSYCLEAYKDRDSK